MKFKKIGTDRNVNKLKEYNSSYQLVKFNFALSKKFDEYYFVKPLKQSFIPYVFVKREKNYTRDELLTLFKSKEARIEHHHAIIEIDDLPLRIIFYDTIDELKRYDIFYSKGIFGVVLDKLLFESQFGVCDRGLIYLKTGEIVCYDIEKILSLFEISKEEIFSIEDIPDYYNLIKKNKFYNSIYFTKYYMYRKCIKERRFYSVLSQIRKYIISNEKEKVEKDMSWVNEYIINFLKK